MPLRSFSSRSFAILVATLVAAPLPCLVATHQGYTWSLLLFVLPLLVTGRLGLTLGDPAARRAVVGTLALLIPMGIVLTVLWADDFFVYPNSAAVLGVALPTIDLLGPTGHVTFDLPVPLEEFLFYILGFAAELSVYLAAAQLLGRPREAGAGGDRILLRDGVLAAAAAVVLVALAWAYKSGTAHPGFPSYLAYLLLVPGVVTCALYRVAHGRIHWAALTVLLLWVLVTSVLWEVVLALPNGWWGYRPEALLGVSFTRLNGLPVEAILVWFLSPWATVISFEALLALQTRTSEARNASPQMALEP